MVRSLMRGTRRTTTGGDRRPFQSLSEVVDSDLQTVLVGLAGRSRRSFGPHYLPLRRAACDVRRAACDGGDGPRPSHRCRRPPDPQAPPLLRSRSEPPWFTGLYDDPREVRIPLSQLGSDVISFTWTDSIAALGLGQHLGVPQPAEGGKRRLYRLDQLDLAGAEALVIRARDDYEGHQDQLLEYDVELELWADQPVAHHLSQ